MHRFQADRPYLAAIAEHYHALRPLRVAVDSASKPWLGYLQTLFATVACEIVPARKAAHFGVQIDGYGETCRVSDEQGRDVPPERLRLLLAKQICGAAELDPLMKSRAEVSAAMRAGGAALGFGPGPSYWHTLSGAPLPDALLTVTWLLKILSRGDEPLSKVLDREVPAR